MPLTFDAVETTTQRTYTPAGFLKIPAVLARSGIYEYRAGLIGHPTKAPDEIVRVYRPADEVFKRQSMDSFASVPVTNDHPSKPVTVDNINSVGVGWSGEQIGRDGDTMTGVLLVTDRKAITDIESGKKGVSNGYLADYEYAPGQTPEGDAYDVTQRNIRGNHIAIVRQGRGGAVCAVADSKGEHMRKVTVAGKEIEVEDTVADAIEASQAETQVALDMAEVAEKDADEAKGKLKALEDEDEAKKKEAKAKEDKGKTTDAAEADARVARAEAERDAALAKVPTDDAIDERVKVRSSLVADATRLWPDKEKPLTIDGKSNEDIRRAVVYSLDDADLTGKTDDYIEVRFDLLAAGGGEANRFGARNLSGRSTSDNADKIVTARDRMVADQQDAWKSPEDRKSA